MLDFTDDQAKRKPHPADVVIGKERRPPSAPRPGPTNIDAIAGENLRRIRLARGFSQEQMGKALKTSYQTIQKFETGKTAFTVLRASELAKALDVTVQDLFRGTGVFGDDVSPFDIRMSQSALELARMYDAIVDDAQRNALKNLARTMAQAED